MIKEQTRGVWNTQTFKKSPDRIVIEMVGFSVFCLNAFPWRWGWSPTLGERARNTGHQIDFANNPRIPFGTYAHVRDEPDPLNIMAK